MTMADETSPPHALSARLTPHTGTHAHAPLHPHMYHSQFHSQSHSAPPHTHRPSLSLRSMNGWVTLEAIIKALRDNELKVLDAYNEKNLSPIFEKERVRLPAATGEKKHHRNVV